MPGYLTEHYFWICLWGRFWMKSAFNLVDSVRQFASTNSSLILKGSRNCYVRPPSLCFYWCRSNLEWKQEIHCTFLFLHIWLSLKTPLVFSILKHKHLCVNKYISKLLYHLHSRQKRKQLRLLSANTEPELWFSIVNLHNTSVNSIISFRHFCMFHFIFIFPDHR